ncbi:hypothetical protein [Terrimonas ferruginea]|uniref:hypothetical protein n=1 Tax=Terrimonas ferruginea TaxID=249 RepID=UPI00042A392A|nr:hypothetical protein [Terrimonas ferruginea]
MKITAILLLEVCLQVSANGFSQSVTLKMENAPLEKVFSEVEQQSGYSFVYTKDVLARAKPVTVQLTNANIGETLNRCFTN